MTATTPLSTALTRIVILALIVGIGLSACGRKGSLERPGAPQAAAGTQQEPSLTGGFGTEEAPDDDAPIVPNRRFILDPLID